MSELMNVYLFVNPKIGVSTNLYMNKIINPKNNNLNE